MNRTIFTKQTGAAEQVPEPAEGKVDYSGWDEEPIGLEYVVCPWKNNDPKPWDECQVCRFFGGRDDTTTERTERVIDPETGKGKSVPLPPEVIKGFLCYFPTHKSVKEFTRSVPPKEE